MKLAKIETCKIARIPLGTGSIDNKSFVISILVDASGVLIEIGDDKYLLSTEEILLEVVKELDKLPAGDIK